MTCFGRGMRWRMGLVAILTLGLSPLTAQDAGFREEYALAKNREAVLKKLVPGTDEYYFYHSLFYQQTQQYAKVDAMLAEWQKKLGKGGRWKMIRLRQALLTYERQPEKTLEFLRRELNLTFPDDRRRSGGNGQRLPSRLDPQQVSRETIAKRLLSNPRTLQGFQVSAHYWLATQTLSPQQRHELLRQATRPDLPNMVKLIHDDFASRLTRSFGDLNIHLRLTRRQLDELARLRPATRNEAKFVRQYVLLLRPGGDETFDDDAVRRAYLDRLWQFARALAPVHNSLKAHVLYHRLKFDLEHGEFNKQRFMEYLALPRRAGYVNPTYLSDKSRLAVQADLNANLKPMTLLDQIGDDQWLVRAYLEHFFREEQSYDSYLPFLKDSFVKRVFAETKILYGLGDPKEWTTYLSPTEYAAIVKRVELRFVPTNPQRFSSDDPVVLELDVKNVPTLLVKVYRINTWNYYRSQQRQVDTDIDLDGLVPNWEQRYEYRELPQRRVRRKFEFPQLKETGVYVVDFIGNSQQSRVVVRKGKLDMISRTTPAGQRITILDENRRPLPRATLWLGGRRFQPDDKGSIVVPFSSQPGTVPVILSHGGVHSLAMFRHQGEVYSLQAGIVVNRESLLAGHEATVIVRPQLDLNGTPVSLSLLEEPRLLLRFLHDRDIATSSEVRPFALSEDSDSTHTFRVPPRTRRIIFELRGKLRTVITAKEIELATQQQFDLNAIDATAQTAQLLLAQVKGSYRLSVRGRNGEPLAGRVVGLQFRHRDFQQPVQVALQTDGRGTIELGALPNIVSVDARLADADLAKRGMEKAHWNLRDGDHSWRRVVHAQAGEKVEIACVDEIKELDREVWSLFAVRDGALVEDEFEQLGLANGNVEIAGLAPGDYLLRYHPRELHAVIRVSKGEVIAGHVVGKSRALELRGRKPLQIAKLEVTQKTVRVRLANSSPYARVHIFANRYLPRYDGFGLLANVVDAEALSSSSPTPRSVYLQERRIGDEYRYVLDRQAAEKFPGNMLARPSLLLDPWSPKTTENKEVMLRPAEGLARSGGGGQGRGDARPARTRREIQAVTDVNNLDFLAKPGRSWFNLKADESGSIELPIGDLQGWSHVTVLAVDPDDTVMRSVSLAAADDELVDLRLAKALDVKQHFVQTKKVTVVGKGKQLVISDYRSSRVKIYDNLAQLFSLYQALQEIKGTGKATLNQFRFLTRWKSLDAKEQEKLYAEYACHELNVFLYYKDRKFFDRVVVPHLENKSPLRFTDRWLLGLPLERYGDTWELGRLNAFERAVLARRIGGLESIRRDVVPMLELGERQPDARWWFDVALHGGALEAAGAAGEMLWSKNGRFGVDPNSDAGGVGQVMRRAQTAPSGKPAAPAAGKSLSARMRKLAEKRKGNVVADELAKKADGKVQLRAGYFEADRAARDKSEQESLFIPLEKTRAWVEMNYYRVPLGEMNSQLVPWSRLWVDFAEHQGEAGFLSSHLAEASGNATTALLALAVSDLPFEAGKHEVKLEGSRMEVAAATPLVAFHEQIEAVEEGDALGSMLVSQVYFALGVSDPEAAVLKDRELLVGVPYGCRVVLSNPTSRARLVDVLTQIPAGAMPVKGARTTESRRLVVSPYSTVSVEYHFYFPAVGEYLHYPAQVSERADLVAAAAEETVTVVRERTKIDRSSWADVARSGTTDEVIAFLQTHSLRKHDLGLIAGRMKERSFYDRVTALLEARRHYDHRLASYAIYHRDSAERIKRFLQHEERITRAIGLAISSPILRVDPIVRRTYEHVEFRPLVNSRAHAIGDRRPITNSGLLTQYRMFLDWLCQSGSIDDARRLELTYYLLLQDRIGEAKEQFARIDRHKIERKMQFDYCAAYMQFFEEDARAAQTIAKKYVDYPVPRWRNAFREIVAQVDEIEGKGTRVVDATDREQRQAAAAAARPVVDMELNGDRFVVRYRNVKQVDVRFYPMDIELLFSRNPFVQQYGDRFGQVHPYRSLSVKLDAAAGEKSIEIPAELRARHMLIEVRGAGVSVSKVRFASSLRVELVETQGMLRVTTSGDRPLPKAYVKVYARTKGGSVRFFKDGYTDLRGRFDYATLSTNLLDSVDRFAILVLSEKDGAVIREAAPPKR